ncbi:MchS3 family protein [Pantoea agglomerans pv. betae]|uniref:MchS3 family protein n=1 Tax=Enterobacter agglomerans TaxID=549 RepID=UPI0007E596F4|nr:MchS3 family protein [Pantoea agglomerans]WHU84233.1 MchS3 family protein [Pantoea agglomerans pv. betae]
MKWNLIPLIFVTGLTTVSAQPQQEIRKELSIVNLFSIGFNGFVARKMPQQIIYEKALTDNNSVNIFQTIIEDATSTPEAKAYAACGLWEKKQLDKIKIKKEYDDLSVTLLTADILKQEPLGKVIGNIMLHGCK